MKLLMISFCLRNGLLIGEPSRVAQYSFGPVVPQEACDLLGWGLQEPRTRMQRFVGLEQFRGE